MTEIPTPLASPVDAITIVRALVDPEVAPELHNKFGTVLEATVENAQAWKVKAIDDATPSGRKETTEAAIWEEARRASALRQQRLGNEPFDESVGPPSLTGDLDDVMSEPEPFTAHEPHPFTYKESKVVVTALKKAAAKDSPEAAELLGRLPKARLRHVAAMVAIAAFVKHR